MAFVSTCTPVSFRRDALQSSQCSLSTSFLGQQRHYAIQHKNVSTTFHSKILKSTVTATSSASSSTATSTVPKILISGAPASGKGTQCELLVANYNVVHISTGDMLRSAVKSGTELGVKAKSYMDAGELVPDELIISLLLNRLNNDDCRQRGWLLDGFPRTQIQAQALDEANIIPDSVVVLDVPDDILIDRVVGRRLDPETGKIYHVKYNPPKDQTIESRLIRRSDDTEEKAKKRLENYYKHAQSIFDHYGSKKVKTINGNQSKQEVFQMILQIIDNKEDSDGDDDSNNNPSNSTISPVGTPSATLLDTSPSSPGSAKGLSVSEFVRRAEEAYETGTLQTKDVSWSGQATLDDGMYNGRSNYSDIFPRLDLALGDTIAFLTFAYIGRSVHGDKNIDLALFKTALPFLTAWFLTTPLLGCYTRAATANLKATFQSFIKAWVVAVPMGLALRGVVTEHVPPMMFTIITLTTTFVIVGSWRLTYVKIRGAESEAGMRGGMFDGLRMVTTLLKRW